MNGKISIPGAALALVLLSGGLTLAMAHPGGEDDLPLQPSASSAAASQPAPHAPLLPDPWAWLGQSEEGEASPGLVSPSVPLVSRVVRFQGGEPDILFLIGEGFGACKGQVAVTFEDRDLAFELVNDSCIALFRPLEALAQDCVVTLAVRGQRVPIGLPRDLPEPRIPSDLLMDEQLRPEAIHFNSLLRIAFPLAFLDPLAASQESQGAAASVTSAAAAGSVETPLELTSPRSGSTWAQVQPLLPEEGAQAGSGHPALLTVASFLGQNPTIFHLVGEGFGTDPDQVEVHFNGLSTPFLLINEAYITACWSPGLAQTTLVQVRVQDRVTQYDLDRLPLRFQNASDLLLAEGSSSLLARFNHGVRRAFELPLAQTALPVPAPAGSMTSPPESSGVLGTSPSSGSSPSQASGSSALPLVGQISCGAVVMDTETGHVQVNGVSPKDKLGPLEFKLLASLVQAGGIRVPTDQLKNHLGLSNRAALASLVYRLRAKIEPDRKNPTHILSCGKSGGQVGGYWVNP